MRGVLTPILLTVISAHPAAAQERPRKLATAVRVSEGAIRVDGRLDETEWRQVPAVTDFLQKEPVEGVPPTESMEIRFVYDDTALFIGARMHSGRAEIQAPMSRRDEADQAEFLLIALDTYLDRRTAYDFGVTASGVRIDRYHASDDENNYDSGFDPVWQAETTKDEDGWTAEFWLPFAQLRFNAIDELVWGLDIVRSTPTLEEKDYWAPVPRTERGWASYFGELRGISKVGRPHRLEVLPYGASASSVNAHVDAADPFHKGLNLDARGGADVKVGFGPNLTLDGTVNPDFGQVEADPAVVNLSAFETFFPEKRPFFLTSSDLISRESNYFYSRRIGARPVGPAAGDFVDYPDTATILGAAKLTGRLPSRTSIGALTAVTGNEFARTATGGVIAQQHVAPTTSFSAARVQQEIGRQGSTIGLEMTNLHRSMDAGDPLADLLVRNALTVVGDSVIRFDNRTYQSNLNFGMSYLAGNAAAIDLRQRSNVRYFQRPDGPAGRYDPTRTSLGGFSFRASVDKIAGRHWLWGLNSGADSPKFETNEMGRLNDSNDIPTGGYLLYRETQPGPFLRSYQFQISTGRTYDFDSSLGTRVNYFASSNVTFKNFWSTSIFANLNLRAFDQRLTRGGPAMATPLGWSIDVNLRNSSAQTTRVATEFYHFESEDDDWSQSLNASVSVRPAPSWQLSIAPNYSHDIFNRQYVQTLTGGRAETYGNRYIFGFIDRTTLSTQLRLGYTFRPDLNLDVYAEPFAASGRYTGYGELAAPRTDTLRVYGEGGTTLVRQADGTVVVTDGDSSFTLKNGDFNVRSFRSNVVLKWEWRPGSFLYVVWQQNRASSVPDGSHVGLGGLFDSLSAPGDNVAAIKISYWFSPK